MGQDFRPMGAHDSIQWAQVGLEKRVAFLTNGVDGLIRRKNTNQEKWTTNFDNQLSLSNGCCTIETGNLQRLVGSHVVHPMQALQL